MALNITGTFTTGDDNIIIGEGSLYARLDIVKRQDANSISVVLHLWKSKNAYDNGKRPITDSIPSLNELERRYELGADILATAPSSNYGAQPGGDLLIKHDYWVHDRIKDIIIASNPTFTVNIVN
jgi:hypothetical protein